MIFRLDEHEKLPRCRRVLCHGCFDVLTVGHLRHFEAARALGDYLIVTITPDRFVNKPSRPIFPAQIRAEHLSAFWCVDYVAINRWPTAVETINLLRPEFYVKGGEFVGNMTPALEAEKLAVEAVGGQLVFTGEMEFHTTQLLTALASTQ